VEVLGLGVTAEQHVDLLELMQVLGGRNVVSVMVEGGSTLLGSLFDLGLVDKVVAFIGPIVIGGSAAVSPIAGHGAKYLTESLHLGDMQVKRLGKDIMITGYPVPHTAIGG
jgi:diaminohydroxyphosphoribosylaminopyrimidine deaminase/5-amino-6-(5-phosphoribosylamino)uracil reductase